MSSLGTQLKNGFSSSTICLLFILSSLSQFYECVDVESIGESRSLDRFKIGHPQNTKCWDRNGEDSFYSPIDVHNHFRPFGGPSVPFETYLDWMKDHGILFSVVMGIGQVLVKANEDDPDCCYYLHCPTFNYSVTPSTYNDRLNAQEFLDKYKDTERQNEVHLTVSATFPNLQAGVEHNVANIEEMERDFPDVFGWAGEINVFKHALAANRFFNQGKRVTVSSIENGTFDSLFDLIAGRGWPVTLHSDMGCDNYNAVPTSHIPSLITGCQVPKSEIALAHKETDWWSNLLGVHYPAFFHAKSGRPRTNFKKIQHVQVFDAILSRFPSLKVVWAHMGLSKELRRLHPLVHIRIMEEMFMRHANLHADVSWDVLAKQLMMNYMEKPVSLLAAEQHEDLDYDAALFLFNGTSIDGVRRSLSNIFTHFEEDVQLSGSGNVVTGPTHSMALYLSLFHKFNDRFLTGTDFVASLGLPEEYPGLAKFKSPPAGCMKDKANHGRQLTDTSSINIFFSDETFQKIVLGGNFFKLIGKEHLFQPPLMCPTQNSLFSDVQSRGGGGDNDSSSTRYYNAFISITESSVIGMIILIVMLTCLLLILGFYLGRRNS